MRIDLPEGWLAEARRIDSPHQDARPPHTVLDLVVIHGISLPPGEYGGDAVEALFSGRLDTAAHPYFATLDGLRVSAHLLIRRGGEILQFVPFSRRAWHAGISCHAGREACNDFSIGIELEGGDHDPYADAQYHQLTRVLTGLFAAYSRLGPEAVVGHSDIAPGRKTDPGPAFDWTRLRSSLSAIPDREENA